MISKSFARDLEAFHNFLDFQVQLGITFVYDHEVRKTLRDIGVRLDRKIEDLNLPNPHELPVDHEPDFGPDPEVVSTFDDEEMSDD